MHEENRTEDDPSGPALVAGVSPSHRLAGMLRQAAALMGYSNAQANEISSTGGLSFEGIDIAMAEAPATDVRLASDAAFVARLPALSSTDPRTLGFALRTNAHLVLVEGCAIVADTQGEMILLMAVTLALMDAHALAVALRRFAGAAQQVTSQARALMLEASAAPMQ